MLLGAFLLLKGCKNPMTAILMAWGWRAHLAFIPTRISPFWKCSDISSGERKKCRFVCPLTDLFEYEREQGGVSGLSTLLMQEQHQLLQHRSIALTSSAPTQTHQLRQGQGGRWHSGKRESVLLRVEGGGNFFIIHFQKDASLFFLCLASVSFPKTLHHDYSSL